MRGWNAAAPVRRLKRARRLFEAVCGIAKRDVDSENAGRVPYLFEAGAGVFEDLAARRIIGFEEGAAERKPRSRGGEPVSLRITGVDFSLEHVKAIALQAHGPVDGRVVALFTRKDGDTNEM